MSQEILILANRLYVPAHLVTQEHLDQFTYRFEWTEEGEDGELERKADIIKTYKETPLDEGHHYAFARGNIGKLLDLWPDYEIEDKRSIVPLGYDLEMLEEFEAEKGVWKRHDKDSRWPEQSAALSAWLNKGYGILKAPAGWGKTVWVWRLICTLKQRTFFFSHTTGLRDQFIERGRQHTNVLDLERFYKKTIAGAYDTWTDEVYPICSSTFQSWYSEDQSAKLKTLTNSFGLVIVDEGHHVPALTYARILLELNPMYICVITATPERKDGTEVILFDVAGPVVVQATGEQLSCEVEYVNTECDINASAANASWSGPWGFMLKRVVNDRSRNDLIVRRVIEDIELGHKVLVLSDRQAHCELLSEQINASGYRSAVVVAYTWNREEIKQKLIKGELDVIVAGKVFNEGEDIPPLSSLHLVTPCSNEPLTEQRIGRIRRPCPGKLAPVIRDYIDSGHSMIFAAKSTRQNVYSRMKFTIKDVRRKDTTEAGLPRFGGK